MLTAIPPTEGQPRRSPRGILHHVPSEPRRQNLEGNLIESLRRLSASGLKSITANRHDPRMLEPLKLHRVDVDPGVRDDRSSSETRQVQAGRRDLEQ